MAITRREVQEYRGFKVGERVICVDTPSWNAEPEYSDPKGAGWAIGKEFVIRGISFISDKHGAVLWPTNSGSGVWDAYARHASKWPHRANSKKAA